MRHRIQITLTDVQYERLREASARRGNRLAELIRRAVDQALDVALGPLAVDALEASAGGWRGREFDGEDYVEALRPGLRDVRDHRGRGRRWLAEVPLRPRLAEKPA